MRPREGRETCLKFLFASEFKKFELSAHSARPAAHSARPAVHSAHPPARPPAHSARPARSTEEETTTTLPPPELLEQLEVFKTAFRASPEVWVFVRNVVSSLAQNHQSIDELLKSQLKSWKLDRLSYTDKNILRIALCEILYLGLNPKIAINEAIELSKVYSSLNSASFINGILDAILDEKGLKHE